MSSVLTVSQLNNYIGSMIKSDVKLRGIAVKGELSNVSVHYKTGIMFFSLKDDDSLVSAIMFPNNLKRLTFVPEDGATVIAFGNIDTYLKEGKYQIAVTDIQPVGVGNQALSVMMLRTKLEKLGVFDTSIKRPIPPMPEKIAVVTSPNGAAIRDIINILGRRYPVCKVEVYPSSVQGTDAAFQLAASIKQAGSSDADVVIVARGGGSAEDLSAFNAEEVVMAVYDCRIPVISAVGHETDTTLTDHAADLCVPTPSAAAEVAVPDMNILLSDIESKIRYIKNLLYSKIDQLSDKIEYARTVVALRSPEKEFEQRLAAVDRLREKLEHLFAAVVAGKEKQLAEAVGGLYALDPFGVMERGYSIVTRNGAAVRNANDLTSGDRVSIRFSSGTAEAEIINTDMGDKDNEF